MWRGKSTELVQLVFIANCAANGPHLGAGAFAEVQAPRAAPQTVGMAHSDVLLADY